MADEQPPPQQKPKPEDFLDSATPGSEIAFGSRTVAWYKWAAWFSDKIYRSRAQTQLTSGEQAFAILCKGDELGLPPFAAWTWIYQTKAGRLAIMTKGALAVVQASPAFEDYEERIEQEGTPDMRGVAIAKRKGRKPVLKEFTLADAEAAGLLREGRTRDGGKYDTTYQSYLKDMLLARARGRALDIAFAVELGGIPVEGVAEDIDNAEAQRRLGRGSAVEAAAPDPPPPPVQSAPRRDPLLAQVGRRELPANLAAEHQLKEAERLVAGPGGRLGILPGSGVDVGPARARAAAAAAEMPTVPPEDVEIVPSAEADVEAIFGPEKSVAHAGNRRGQGREETSPGDDTGSRGGPGPAAQPEAARPPAMSVSRAARPVSPTGPPKEAPFSSPCQRCNHSLNAMGGCDVCGWPGSDIR